MSRDYLHKPNAFYYYLLVCLLFPTLTYGQFADCESPWKTGPICGKIVDYATGLPIQGAQISGDPSCSPNTTTSNNQGFYCLNLNCDPGARGAPAIRYNNTVTVKATGYYTFSLKPVNGRTDSVNFYMSRSFTCTRTNDSLTLIQMSNAMNLNWPTTTVLATGGWGASGLRLNAAGCVAEINMKVGFGTVGNGILPPSFGTMTALEQFDMGGDNVRYVSGTFPDFSNFKNLGLIRVNTTRMTGGLPVSLGKLKNLTQIGIYNNLQLGGTIPPEYADIRELCVLQLGRNGLTGQIPTGIGNLKKLTSFYLDNNLISGTIPTGFGTCDSLREFFVDSCRNLTGTVDFLFRLPKLQYLGIAGNKFSGIVPTIPTNSNFEFINVADNQFDSLRPITRATFLLSVKRNKFTFDDILPNIRYFDTTGQTCVNDYQKNIASYAPQDSIGTEKTITVSIGSNITIDELKIDGAITTNRYQWFKNGVVFGAVLNVNKFTIANFKPTDEGVYCCQVTNPNAPKLTLYSRCITLRAAGCAAAANTQTLDIARCFGQTYTSPSGKILITTGTYRDTLKNINRCDSIAFTINLTIQNNATRQVLTPSVCTAYTSPSGKILSNSGNYVDTLKSRSGCDSIIYAINLTIQNNAARRSLTPSVCTAYRSPSGKIFNVSGNYADTLKNRSGCDSIIYAINLTIQNNATRQNLTPSVCTSFIAPTGKILNTSGVYGDTLKSRSGCDSIIYNINLNVQTTQRNQIQQSVCKGEIFKGKTINNDTTFTEILRSTYLPCDSLITTTVVKVKPPSTNTLNIVLCSGRDTTINGKIYNATNKTGQTILRGASASGCDSIVNISVNFVTSVRAIADEFTIKDTSNSFICNVLANDVYAGAVRVKALVQPLLGRLDTLSSGRFLYTFPPQSTGTALFRYQLCGNVCQNACDTALVKITIAPPFQGQGSSLGIIPDCGCGNSKLIFSELITNPSQYPNRELTIISRWGDVVYRSQPYENEWQGTNQKGEDLPAGTYYYIMRLDLANGKIKTGDVTIYR